MRSLRRKPRCSYRSIHGIIAGAHLCRSTGGRAVFNQYYALPEALCPSQYVCSEQGDSGSAVVIETGTIVGITLRGWSPWFSGLSAIIRP